MQNCYSFINIEYKGEEVTMKQFIALLNLCTTVLSFPREETTSWNNNSFHFFVNYLHFGYNRGTHEA